MIRVGFSTHKYNPLSWFIRKITGAEFSHCWLMYYDTVLGFDVVLEAGERGFEPVPYDRFRQSNTIVEILTPPFDLNDGLRTVARRYLGTGYDTGGLIGEFFVMLAQRLGRAIRNPLSNPKTLFCSESIVDVCRESNAPYTHQWPDSATFNPLQINRYLRSQEGVIIERG